MEIHGLKLFRRELGNKFLPGYVEGHAAFGRVKRLHEIIIG